MSLHENPNDGLDTSNDETHDLRLMTREVLVIAVLIAIVTIVMMVVAVAVVVTVMMMTMMTMGANSCGGNDDHDVPIQPTRSSHNISSVGLFFLISRCGSIYYFTVPSPR